MLKSEYLTTVYKKLENKHPTEQEFLQSVYSFFDTISDYVSENDYIEKNGVIERLVVPERIITFRVPWVDDLGKVQVNYGYRVEFNSSLGPYKGGLRFHPTVNESLLKFLAFEQTFKNALTGLPLGGGKGGSDFDPKDKSENEIMRFCHSFMAELYRYIGPNTDVPAGDIGVGAREIGYLFGYYKKLKNEFTGAITGKGVNYGGSLVRKEATGYGLCYFTEEALKSYLNTTFKDKKVIISGSGNVALYTAIKAYELGGKVIAMSDIDGYIYDEEGLDIEYLRKIKEEERKPIKEYTVKYPLTKYNDNSKKIWEIPCDIALPCATQNELDLESVKALVSNGVIAVCEGANKPIIPEGIKYLLNNKIVYGPCIAANAGGVATSGLEMTQNSLHHYWTFEEVDNRLKTIMKTIFGNVLNSAKELNKPHNLYEGAYVAAFKKICDAMLSQGII